MHQSITQQTAESLAGTALGECLSEVEFAYVVDEIANSFVARFGCPDAGSGDYPQVSTLERQSPSLAAYGRGVEISAEHLAADDAFGPCLLPDCPNSSQRETPSAPLVAVADAVAPKGV